MSETHSGALYSSLSTGWMFMLRIPRTFNISVCPPWRFFADKTAGKGDLSNNLNSAAPSCWESDQDALTIFSVSEIYPSTIISSFWAQNSLDVAYRFWLPCNILNMSWTLAIRSNCHSSGSCCISELFSVLVQFNSAWAPAKIPLLARGNCSIMSFSPTASPVVFDCLQQISSRRRQNCSALYHHVVW